MTTPHDEVMERLALVEEKLDRLLAYAEKADTAVTGFLGGKNAKYLALLAKAKGGGW